MPWSPTRGISGFCSRAWSTAPGRSSASRKPRRWWKRSASTLSLVVVRRTSRQANRSPRCYKAGPVGSVERRAAQIGSSAAARSGSGPGTGPSHSGVASVDQVVAAGDEGCGVGGQEDRQRGNLVRCAEPSEGVLARDGRLGLLVEVRVDERRGDEAGSDRVDPHALCGVLESGVLGQADDRVLGGHVGSVIGEADRPEDRGDVDDRAAALRGGNGRQLSSPAAATQRSANSWSVTSPTRLAAVPPAAWISSTTAFTLTSLMSVTRTAAPLAASRRAIACPIPEPAPVTIAERPPTSYVAMYPDS